MKINESQIVDALRHLDPSRWNEVLDFIGFLQQRPATRSTTASIRTAHDLLQSQLVEVWADRTDIGDSLTFARQLRQRAERRLIAVPRPTLDPQVALTSWGRIYKLGSFHEEKIATFIEDLRNKAPEPDAP